MAVNLGTRGVQEACDLLEYCNHPGGTVLVRPAPRRTASRSRTTSSSGASATSSTARGRSARRRPHEYGRLAAETAKAMRLVDPRDRAGRRRQLELARCRRSAPGRRPSSSTPTTQVDYISLHAYYEEHDGDRRRASWPRPSTWTRFIDAVVATADHVGAKLRSRKKLQALLRRVERLVPAALRRPAQPRLGASRRALIEDEFTAVDAVVVGSLLITLLRPRRPGGRRLPGPARQRHRADPHRARRAGLAAEHLPPVRADRPAGARDRAADRADVAPRRHRARTATSPALDATATYDEETGDTVLLAVNRDLHDERAPRGRPPRHRRPARRARRRRAPRDGCRAATRTSRTPGTSPTGCVPPQEPAPRSATAGSACRCRRRRGRRCSSALLAGASQASTRETS